MRLFSASVAALALLSLSACAMHDAREDARERAAYADAAAGLAYARENCASCHAVEMGAMSPRASAPTFESLAARPDMSRPALAALLRQPHRNMPNLIVESDRVNDLAAYLEVLGGE